MAQALGQRAQRIDATPAHILFFGQGVRWRVRQAEAARAEHDSERLFGARRVDGAGRVRRVWCGPYLLAIERNRVRMRCGGL
jgi:hypothetical protein